MVSKSDFTEGLANLKKELQASLDKSIKELREHIIDKLITANQELQEKVHKLEGTVHQLINRIAGEPSI